MDVLSVKYIGEPSWRGSPSAYLMTRTRPICEKKVPSVLHVGGRVVVVVIYT